MPSKKPKDVDKEKEASAVNGDVVGGVGRRTGLVGLTVQ
jgi:hypothetical protein